MPDWRASWSARGGACAWTPAAIERLFAARDADFAHVTGAADALRAAVSGDVVRYVVNRNINYTNICYFKCKFCAFSKGKHARGPARQALRPRARRHRARAREAWDRGATEVCLQGGIHPDYTARLISTICRAVKEAVPEMHIHAFSPLEVTQGAKTWAAAAGVPEAPEGRGPGHAAGHGGRDPRRRGAGDYLPRQDDTRRVARRHARRARSGAAHDLDHHVRPCRGAAHWARHLLALRDLQAETGGFTEFVPLPFVHMEAPMYRQGLARRGPTFREAVLMHAVARLVLNPLISNIQTSWVKMGPAGAALACRPAPTTSAAR
jgi:FO synthase